MADNMTAFSGFPAATTPQLQALRASDATAAFQTFFSSLAEGALNAYVAPTPTTDFEKKVLEWLPHTPSETPSSALGMHRPEPRMPTELLAAPIPIPASMARSRAESPIDVVHTSAFAPVDRSPAMDRGAQEVLTESSTSEHDNVSPPRSGCYTRAPGLGPPETPNSANCGALYTCSVCGFASTSKFHYNSHMNTHGDHQCTMCDYTSRTEGRLKKHMRDSHTTEEQLAAGLDVIPPTAAADASSSTNDSPTKDNVMDSSPEGELSGIDCSPGTLSATLLGMLATSTSSSMTSALEQIRAITEQPLFGDDGLLRVGLSMPQKEEGASRGGKRKMKIFKCKQCPHISPTKEEQWTHARSHIPADKQMNCDKCGFVTEYKHHLEYHRRNHAGIKPFQCNKCNYACVNNSMLNSHMKSHSSLYQFRCADCSYATKYRHSLKLHLEKYGHSRNTEGLAEEADALASLSADGTPQTMRKDSIASISSSLYAPFTPFNLVKQEEPFDTPQMPNATMPQMATSQLLMTQHQFDQMQHPSALKCGMCEFSCGSQDELVRHSITHLLSNSSLCQALGLQVSIGIPDRSAEDDQHTATDSPSGDDAGSHSNGSARSCPGSSDEGEGGASRRKSSKPSRIAIDSGEQHTMEAKQEEAMDTSNDQKTSAADCVTESSEQLVLPQRAATLPLHPLQPMPQQLLQMPHIASNQQALFPHLASMQRSQGARFGYECAPCNMGFADQSIHAVHSSYHSRENPMQCSRCGLVCASALHFNLHLLQSKHI